MSASQPLGSLLAGINGKDQAKQQKNACGFRLKSAGGWKQIPILPIMCWRNR